MTSELRSYYSTEYVTGLAHHFASLRKLHSPKPIIADILNQQWPSLSLKQRMYHITNILSKYLEDIAYEDAINILKQLLVLLSRDQYKYGDMLAMFVPHYVEIWGLQQWDISMQALEFFTSNGTTSEFAIRPFIVQDQTRAMKQMMLWSKYKNHHVRRLSSEGCRPRLPWALRLTTLQHDPSPIIDILDNLRADESLYVRKSVANNLNDISKDHSDVTLTWAKKWGRTNQHTDWIIKRGCRTLLKQANKNALALFALPPISPLNFGFVLSKNMYKLGEILVAAFNAELPYPVPQNLRIEYAIDFMKANGKQNRKIFQVKKFKLANQQLFVTITHLLKQLSTRKHYAGRHNIAIIINGKEIAAQHWILKI